MVIQVFRLRKTMSNEDLVGRYVLDSIYLKKLWKHELKTSGGNVLLAAWWFIIGVFTGGNSVIS